jgi:holo-[acyl-carrier protein] synthase
MIVGLGADIAEVDRIAAAIERRGRAFLERIFTSAEIAYCEKHRNRAERFAGRFAVKEAAMKALGTGWARGVRWVDIEVVREPSGKPTLKLSGAARAIAGQLGVKNIAITITHDGNTALAQVIFES